MSNYNVPQELNVFHVLSFVYLSFAHQTDGELADSERTTITTKVGEWMGDDATRGQINSVIDEAIDWYNSIPGPSGEENPRIDEMVKYIDVLKGYFEDVKNRRAIYADVEAIVHADGTVSEVETAWLQLLKKGLEV